jgi:DNA-binding protein YbaB
VFLLLSSRPRGQQVVCLSFSAEQNITFVLKKIVKPMVLCAYGSLLLGAFVAHAYAFSLGPMRTEDGRNTQGRLRFRRPSQTNPSALRGFNIGGWFSGKSEEKNGYNGEGQLGNLEGVPSIMDSMDNFKRSQRVGKMTASLMQELASTSVEGVAADGKVKVTFDCQQRPTGVNIDETYFESADVLDVNNACTSAMKEAHSKSVERMEEKMKSFYSELGLDSNR